MRKPLNVKSENDRFPSLTQEGSNCFWIDLLVPFPNEVGVRIESSVHLITLIQQKVVWC